LIFAYAYSLLDDKARKWRLGQRHWRSVKIDALLEGKTVWFHCASVGEFEQARPVIESLKDGNSEIKILLTFYSPSGFEVHENYELADCITYIPADIPSLVEEFLSRMKPDVVVFIKYELWFNFIQIIRRRNIPMALICAHFPEKHFVFSWLAKSLGSKLKLLSEIQVQNEQTKARLNQIGLGNVLVAGDTRFERVVSVSNESYANKCIERFVEDSQVIVIGSNWPSDDNILLSALSKFSSLKVIVAPHEMDQSQLENWREIFGEELMLWSEMVEGSLINKRVLYVDTLGVLSKLYRYAHVAYVGGGFGKSVHNTLEAAVYGIPVLFGPNNARFDEIQQLKRIGSGFEIKNAQDFSKQLDVLLNSEEVLQTISALNEEYFDRNRGAVIHATDWVRQSLKVKKPS